SRPRLEQPAHASLEGDVVDHAGRGLPELDRRAPRSALDFLVVAAERRRAAARAESRRRGAVDADRLRILDGAAFHFRDVRGIQPVADLETEREAVASEDPRPDPQRSFRAEPGVAEGAATFRIGWSELELRLRDPHSGVHVQPEAQDLSVEDADLSVHRHQLDAGE